MKGRFITFEGVEGSGKSTQIERVRRWLEQQGLPLQVTREPGGCPIAEIIRSVLLDPANTGMSPVAELLLYEAARTQHVTEVILPGLEAGRTILCDRFIDSTTAYQGAGRALEPDLVQTLHQVATAGLRPDLTIVLDIPAHVGLERAASRRAKDRIEQETLAFHERVRAMFLSLAEQDPDRVKVVDGLAPEDVVTEAIVAHLRGCL